MRSIPLIDLSTTSGTVAEVEAACRDVGFMYIVGHGIGSNTIAAARQAIIAYFSQSESQKHRDRISRDNYRGYIPAGFFSPAHGQGANDDYEGYKLHVEVEPDDPICVACDLYGPNKWPQEPQSMRAAMLAYWHECDRVALRLLTDIAAILGTDREAFLSLFEMPLTNMTLLHYPPQAANSQRFGIHPHKDTDALTILAADPVGGLYVRARDADEWIRVDAPEGALIVNIGDLLEIWSGGYLVSTPHKVVNDSGKERFSFPYFVVPRYDTVVRP
ncbi:MAG: isopenicillin N synthase family oxygenase, partial [Gammaproteobacteria bacterium]|nr:isopenicillin N synthase family oxygenase [Gammaproteobacteria bacterium]